MNRVKMVAFGGVFGALSIALSFMGSIIPAAAFIAPAIAGFLLLVYKEMCGLKGALCTFFVVTALLFLIAPKKETAFSYGLLFGYYPAIFSEFDRLRSKVTRFLLKAIIFEGVGVLSLTVILILVPTIKQHERFSLIVVAGIIVYNIFILCYEGFIYVLLKQFGASMRERLKGLK